jgi:hypothetical protein
MNLARHILLWLPMIGIAILNGAAREVVLAKPLGELHARQLSTLTLIVLLGVYIWFIVPALAPASGLTAATVGLQWLALTIGFEFLFGHYVSRKPLRELIEDYNLAAGRIWALVPLWVAVAPYVFYRLRK